MFVFLVSYFGHKEQNRRTIKQINKKATFFVTKSSLWECLFAPQESFVLLSFCGGELVISWS